MPAAVLDGAVECLLRAVDECAADILPCLCDHAGAAVQYVITVAATDFSRWARCRQAALALRADAEQLVAASQFEEIRCRQGLAVAVIAHRLTQQAGADQ
ncbi:hypothetical protein D3C72_1960360 [compost metagenome]